MKTEVYNLIILDESGSMCRFASQTIDGCNETINTIHVAQERFAETQDHFVSIFAFQSDGPQPSRYLCKNIPAKEARHITKEDYSPSGCTPLYDAVGSTIVDLKSLTKSREMAIGSVTIITDGAENSSTHYSLNQVASMIDALKEMGWNFNFIGANIDVKGTAASLNIDNSLEFFQTEEGTKDMFVRERVCRIAYNQRINDAMLRSRMDNESDTDEAKRQMYDRLRDASSNYFDDDNKE